MRLESPASPPTFSHEYAGEGADLLPLPPRATKGPRVALGVDWGEGGSSRQGLRLKHMANQVEFLDRIALPALNRALRSMYNSTPRTLPGGFFASALRQRLRHPSCVYQG